MTPSDADGQSSQISASQTAPINVGASPTQPTLAEPPAWRDKASQSDLAREIVKIRYDHTLQRIQSTNENVFRFLTIYQTLISTLTAGQVLLFINHKNWSLDASTTKIGIFGILVLETIVGIFTALMIMVGALSWLDYRSEECDISDVVLGESFRRRATLRNWYRWYETYIIMFIFLSLAVLWLLGAIWMVPAI